MTLSSFRAKFLVVCDVMTLGRETSPVNTAAIVQAARAVQAAGLGERVRFLSITIDPERDTTARLTAYRRLYTDPPADWTLLTGTPDAIAALWDYFGVHRQLIRQRAAPVLDWMTLRPVTHTVAHNDQVHFLDGARHDRFVLAGPGHVLRTAAVPAPLDVFLDATGQRELSDPQLTSWTARQVLNVLGWLTARQIPSPDST